jgi:hypothetical protein
MGKVMRKKRVLLLLGLGLLVATSLLLSLFVLDARAEPVGTSPNFRLTWEVFSSGGNVMTGDSYRLSSTSGQALVRQSASTNYEMQHGFWTGIGDFLSRLLLPLVTR